MHPIVVKSVNRVSDLVNDLSKSLPYSTGLFSFFISVLDPYPVSGNENRGREFPQELVQLFFYIASNVSCTNSLSAATLLKNWVASSQPSLSTTGGRCPTPMGSRTNTSQWGE